MSLWFGGIGATPDWLFDSF